MNDATRATRAANLLQQWAAKAPSVARGKLLDETVSLLRRYAISLQLEMKKQETAKADDPFDACEQALAAAFPSATKMPTPPPGKTLCVEMWVAYCHACGALAAPHLKPVANLALSLHDTTHDCELLRVGLPIMKD